MVEENIVDNLEKFINSFVSNYTFSSSTHNGIEIFGYNKTNKNDIFCLIRVILNNQDNQIYIPTIFVPAEMEHQGIGKKMIYIIYHIGTRYGYDVFVTDLVESFYNKLLIRGAETCDQPDILQITENTNLINPVN